VISALPGLRLDGDPIHVGFQFVQIGQIGNWIEFKIQPLPVFCVIEPWQDFKGFKFGFDFLKIGGPFLGGSCDSGGFRSNHAKGGKV